MALYFGFVLLENNIMIHNKIINTIWANNSILEIYPKEIIQKNQNLYTHFVLYLICMRRWTLAEPVVVIISQCM